MENSNYRGTSPHIHLMLVAVISLPRKISAGMAVQGGPHNVDYDGSTCLVQD
jgi:hypothetical protein